MDKTQIIYFDNSATTVQKPPGVAEAIVQGMERFGNAGRSFYSLASDASMELYLAREEVARLFGAEEPLHVAFTSSATESLNLVIYGLISQTDHVITTKCEHNSVLRPLYNTGADLSFLDLDHTGRILRENLHLLLKENTKAVVCTHGSNLTGNITDVEAMKIFCDKHGLLLILDISQTGGSIPVDAAMADFICFTGHKGMMGPQGTGGIVCSGSKGQDAIKIIKTGGSGSNSFDRIQPRAMPDIFEAGTHNVHSLSGLKKACEYINRETVASIHMQEMEVTRKFIDGLKEIRSITFYGDIEETFRLPIVAINVGEEASEDIAFRLWDEYKIATRSGTHCAPLLHKHFETQGRGMIRFSFSHFNTREEIDTALEAIGEISCTI